MKQCKTRVFYIKIIRKYGCLWVRNVFYIFEKSEVIFTKWCFIFVLFFDKSDYDRWMYASLCVHTENEHHILHPNLWIHFILFLLTKQKAALQKSQLIALCELWTIFLQCATLAIYQNSSVHVHMAICSGRLDIGDKWPLGWALSVPSTRLLPNKCEKWSFCPTLSLC